MKPGFHLHKIKLMIFEGLLAHCPKFRVVFWEGNDIARSGNRKSESGGLAHCESISGARSRLEWGLTLCS